MALAAHVLLLVQRLGELRTRNHCGNAYATPRYHLQRHYGVGYGAEHSISAIVGLVRRHDGRAGMGQPGGHSVVQYGAGSGQLRRTGHRRCGVVGCSTKRSLDIPAGRHRQRSFARHHHQLSRMDSWGRQPRVRAELRAVGHSGHPLLPIRRLVPLRLVPLPY